MLIARPSADATPAAALEALAHNLRWTWHGPTRDLLDNLLEGFEGASTGHPAARLSEARAEQPDLLTARIADNAETIGAHYHDLIATIDSTASPEIAYFSPEFGIAAQVAQYSGGLGILAGDHLKAASDLALPLIGVGLLYRQGFFRQSITGATQLERYETIEPPDIGAEPTGVTISVPVAGESVQVAVWHQRVGATSLVLLDTDLPANSPSAQKITDRLYSGDRRHRLDQELVLGVGGVRALRALGVDPAVFHLNEGHACFLLLELLAEHIEAGSDLDAAIAAVRASTLFTTHTPVPAGIDRFDRSLAGPELKPWADRLGVELDTLLDWARLPSDGPDEPFNTAALAFELCGRSNGVSQLHASVSRDLFATLPRSADLIGITNGVHARTWVAPAIQAIYDDTLDPGWTDGDPDAWAKVDQLDIDRLAKARAGGRHDLTRMVAARTGVELDPHGCVIGFARRFATYKRAALMLRDPDGLAAAFDAGAQFVFAGKAHPADTDGKAVLAELARFAQTPAARGRLVVVPDYDIAVAQTMYGGSDVWLNNPIRPREASGTSGEKAALNGGLNCSILDGWWADYFVDGIGWAIPTSDLTAAAGRDLAEAKAMNQLIADQVLADFDTEAWWAMVLRMLAHLGPRVTAGRMVAEYEQLLYGPIRR